MDMPEKLRNATKEYLNTYKGSKLLTTTIRESWPYKDKSIKDTTYGAYLEWGNLLTVLSIMECSKHEWSDDEVKNSSMKAGDIQEFIKHSIWFN